ncbi:unnamed protein product [Meganyctiphanes norvegica]|uniref:Uncharacterized protein n=1 Tax=Meganyctiphanes norvegica TaxID=48144 RepID=A0AAV2QS23_MEGNR
MMMSWFANTQHWFGLGSAVALTLVIFTYLSFMKKKEFARKRRKWSSVGRDVVVLHCLPRCHWAPSLSPFNIKLETYFRMAKIPYQLDFTEPMAPVKKGMARNTTPWITINGEEVVDSQLIIEYIGRALNIDLSAEFTKEQRAVARAFSIMADEHLIWGIRVWRYITDRCSSQMAGLPLPWYIPLSLAQFIARWRSPYMIKALETQGMGRHKIKDVNSIVQRDLSAISDYIGDKPYLMGTKLCEADCSVFAHLANILYNYPGSPHEATVKDEFVSLVEYVERVKTELWPDWEACLAQS